MVYPKKPKRKKRYRQNPWWQDLFGTSDNGYQNFHGRKPKYRGNLNFHNPKKLIRLGRALETTYISDKWNGGGDGTYAAYKHKHNPGVSLYMDERNRGQLYLIGKKLKVTDAGIEN